MALIRQIIIGMVLVAATLALWIVYVPASRPYLERAGILDLLGIEPAEGKTDDGGRGFGGGGPATVITAPVGEAAINNRIETIGDGQAVRLITVRAEVSGTVSDIVAAPGTRIGSQSVILRLKDDSERLAVERARLTLRNAQSDLDRVTQLANRGAVTSVQSQEAELALRTAEVGLEEAELAVERRVIRAAFDGWIGLISVDQGDRVSAQEQIAVLADRSRIMIDFRVPESAITQIRTGQTFEARPLSMPSRVLEGEITVIDNLVDRTSRTLKVQGRLMNDDDLLRTGMAFGVNLSIEGDTLPSVDPLAVQWSSEGAFVWAVRDGKATRVPIEIRQRTDDAVLVAGEIGIGEEVVTEGVQNLRPGAEVTVAGLRAAKAEDPQPAVTQ